MGETLGLSPEEKDRLVIFSGRTHPDLAKGIAAGMGVELGDENLRDHPDTSPYVRLDENVREKHVIAVQSHGAARGKSMSDSLVEHLGMIDAARLAGATRITALAPNLAGTRQDRQAKARESVSSVLYLRMLRLAGVTDLVTVDPHSPVMPQEDDRSGNPPQ
jgi:ribose-phosphate pyrophosphokinase